MPQNKQIQLDNRPEGEALKEACPAGIDGYFENVGGMVLDAVLTRMNAFGRIALSGMIAGYDGKSMPLTHPALMLVNRLKVQGFIVSEHMEVWLLGLLKGKNFGKQLVKLV